MAPSFSWKIPPQVTRMYLDTLTLWLLPQLEEDSNDFIFQQDGAPPHFHITIRNHLNAHHTQRWIGRAGANDVVCCRWPSRSPDLTLLVGLHKRQSSRLSYAAVISRVEAANHNCCSFHHWGQSAHNMEWVGFSYRHLASDNSRSTYRVSVRCVQSSERFSIDWCMCEVLSTPHLFSVSF